MAARTGAVVLDRPRPPGVVIARIHRVQTNGRVAVTLPNGRKAIARSLVKLSATDRGAVAALVFEGGDPDRPLVLGLVVDGLTDGGGLAAVSPQPAPPSVPAGVQISRDGKRLLISAEEEVVLRCGGSSVTLTAAGKVLVNGKYVSSRSSGVNRIRGASIQLN
jgi:hypothetical protein